MKKSALCRFRKEVAFALGVMPFSFPLKRAVRVNACALLYFGYLLNIQSRSFSNLLVGQSHCFQLPCYFN